MKTSVIIIAYLLILFNPQGTTIENLQKAYISEVNTAHKFKLFSGKADKEGYYQVAKLYRAAAKSALFHQENYASVIRYLGSNPGTFKFKKVCVKSTKENLTQTIQPRNPTTESVYLSYIHQAQNDKQLEAERAFVIAMISETKHEKLFTDALEHLGSNPPKDYYVSTLTGDIMEVEAGAVPPSPDFSHEVYVKVD